MEKRSRLVLIGSLWTILYAYLISQPELEGLMALLVALVIWPGFFLLQIVLYSWFKGYIRENIYRGLFITKSLIFLVQPILVNQFEYLTITTSLSAVLVLMIDMHVLKLKNKLGISKDDKTKKEKMKLLLEGKKYILIISPIVFLFFLYFQMQEEIHLISILMRITFVSLLLWYVVLENIPKKKTMFCIFYIALGLVWSLTLWDVSEVFRGIILVGILTIVFFTLKSIVKRNPPTEKDIYVPEAFKD